jgi:3-oxoacyl-[acyl-carrier-protein] synthase III
MQTGIKSRGVWPLGTRPSSIATTAAKNLIENNNIQTDDIDMLMFTSVCRDFLEPASASVVHHNLKLPQTCENFDLSNACLGVMQGMSIAATMIEQGYKKKVLIVSGENSGPLFRANHLFS